MADDPTKRTKRVAQRPAAVPKRRVKVTPPKKEKRDFSQVALSIVERVTGGPLAKKRDR